MEGQTSGTFHEVVKRSSRKNATADLIRPAAAEVRGAVLKALASWASLVADERRIAPPPREIPALARFLVRHAEWLAAHPAAGELADEVKELACSARNTAYSDDAGRVRVGNCPTCNGELVAHMRNRDDPLPSEIVCTASSDHVWPATRWATLARKMR